MSDAKQISVETGDGVTRLVIRDRVTISQATELQEAALRVAAEPCDAVLDCSELTHLDSAAVQVLVALRNEFADSSTSMVIQGLDPVLQKYLEGTGLWARLVN